MIVYRMLLDGGFVVGDTDTMRTNYAYPTSAYAVEAKRKALKVAMAMASQANGFSIPCVDYDRRMWALID